MAKYRRSLPQLSDKIFLTEGGLSTSLKFQRGLDLPYFAAFVLMDTIEGREMLREHYVEYLQFAQDRASGIILDTPTWRANPDWAAKLGYGPGDLRAIDINSVALLTDLRSQYETPDTPCVISGTVGPRGDGYKAGRMEADEAEEYHGPQVENFANSEADIVVAYTLTNYKEAIGIANAASARDIPCGLSFTVETNGRMVTGMSLGDVINRVDDATGGAPAYYMINCAHPAHFMAVFEKEEQWIGRLRGLRANASMKSHEELDESGTLDVGDPIDLGNRYRTMRQTLPNLNILGGCCGTDTRHLMAICEACL